MSGDLRKVSAVLVCCDEEENVERCLQSLTWADEIIVVDSFSEDRTVELCKKYTNRIFQREWSGMIQQRAYAVSLAQNEWVFAIDADEVVTKPLRDEILTRLSENNNEYNGSVNISQYTDINLTIKTDLGSTYSSYLTGQGVNFWVNWSRDDNNSLAYIRNWDLNGIGIPSDKYFAASGTSNVKVGDLNDDGVDDFIGFPKNNIFTIP